MDNYQHSKDLIQLTSAVGYKMPGRLHVINIDCKNPLACHHEDLYSATVKRDELFKEKNHCNDYWCRRNIQSKLNSMKDYPSPMTKKDIENWTKARKNMEKAANNKIIQRVVKSVADNRDKIDTAIRNTGKAVAALKKTKSITTKIIDESKANISKFIANGVMKSKKMIERTNSIAKRSVIRPNLTEFRQGVRKSDVNSNTKPMVQRIPQVRKLFDFNKPQFKQFIANAVRRIPSITNKKTISNTKAVKSSVTTPKKRIVSKQPVKRSAQPIVRRTSPSKPVANKTPSMLKRATLQPVKKTTPRK